VQKRLKLLVGDVRELREIRDMVAIERGNATDGVARLKDAAGLLLARCDDRLKRLTDALIDGLIDKQTFEGRNASLLMERKSLLNQIESASENELPRRRALLNLELANAAYLGYRTANSDERRRLLGQFVSNLSACGKYPAIALKSPFQEIAIWRESQNGAPHRGRVRTRARQLLDIIAGMDTGAESTTVREGVDS
jgi:hypothetical protein